MKRKQHGSKGATVFRDPREADRVWVLFDWDDNGWANFVADPEVPPIMKAAGHKTKAQAALEPVYEELDGWSQTTAGARAVRDLPANAVKYVNRIEELIGAPVALLSTSPERDDTILMRDPFQD